MLLPRTEEAQRGYAPADNTLARTSSSGGHAPLPADEQADLRSVAAQRRTLMRIALEVQLGKYAFVAYDLFVKHMAFFVGDAQKI